MTQEVDILFAMNDFSELGIQKVICTMLNKWDTNSFGTVALSVHDTSGKFFPHYHSSAPLYVLNDLVKVGGVPRTFFAIYKSLY